jgi:hypothetical protein
MFKELLADVFPVIEKAAPIIAQALGGPFVGTAITAFNLLSKVFGSSTYDIPLLVKNIMEDPESHQKLLQIQSDFPAAMKEMFIKSLKLPIEAEINIRLVWEAPSRN